MSKVTISLNDENGELTCSIESDPPFPGPANKDQTITAAQHMAFKFMKLMRDFAEDQQDDVDEE